MKIILDLDGVVVDFVAGLHRRLVMEYDETKYPYERGEYEMLGLLADAAKVDMDKIFKICQRRSFWANLCWEPDGHDLLAAIRTHVADTDIFVCTTPMAGGDAWAGKVDWVNYHLPFLKDRLIITTSPKSMLARPDMVLIDDKDKNINEFKRAGGLGFMIPRPWNSSHGVPMGQITPYLAQYLKDLKDVV